MRQRAQISAPSVLSKHPRWVRDLLHKNFLFSPIGKSKVSIPEFSKSLSSEIKLKKKQQQFIEKKENSSWGIYPAESCLEENLSIENPPPPCGKIL